MNEQMEFRKLQGWVVAWVFAIAIFLAIVVPKEGGTGTFFAGVFWWIIFCIPVALKYLGDRILLDDTSATFMKGVIFTKSKTIPYARISSVELRDATRTITISTSDDSFKEEYRWISNADTLLEEMNRRIEASTSGLRITHFDEQNHNDVNHNTDTDIDRLERLAALRNKGMITEEEYTTAKQKIIG